MSNGNGSGQSAFGFAINGIGTVLGALAAIFLAPLIYGVVDPLASSFLWAVYGSPYFGYFDWALYLLIWLGVFFVVKAWAAAALSLMGLRIATRG